MKQTFWLCTVLALVGCGSEGASGSAAASTSGAATQKPAATATAATTAAAVTATATAAAAPTAGAYRGLKDGNVIAGYISDPKDPDVCAVVGATEAEKATLDEAKLKQLATMIKGEVAKSCPTANIVGGCRELGIATQFYGPKYTKDTAKKACKGTWAD